ncbi:MAG: hypothetical protein FWG51_00070 [Firmicutes bacterium]|nr:hypothetical protein [Bacillota bacterium]
MQRTAKIKISTKELTYIAPKDVVEDQYVVVDIKGQLEIGIVLDVNDYDNYDYPFILKKCSISFATRDEAKQERGRIAIAQDAAKKEYKKEAELRALLAKEYKITISRKKSFKGSAIKYSVVHNETNQKFDFGSGDTIIFHTKKKSGVIFFYPLRQPIGGSIKNHSLSFDIQDEDVRFDFEMKIFPEGRLVLTSSNANNIKFS